MEYPIGNAIVGQSGGPTSAINATLVGVINGVSKSNVIDKLFGMQYGIEGLLQGKIIDLSYLFNDHKSLSILESTPASALGSCRKRLPNISEDITIYKKIFEELEKRNIRYFFYIGGNDSMDTVAKLNEYSKICDYEIKIIGIPKTIDNDLVITDHTPGFGSSAKFISTAIQEIACDTSVYLCNAVTIVEIMGRDAGWLTASAGLPKYFGNDGADLIYLPEVPFCNDEFIMSVKELLKAKPNIVVAVSEGIRYENGRYVGESSHSKATDAFGHKYLSGSAKVLEHLVSEKIGCKTRSIELNLLQRCASHISSEVDILESKRIGEYSVECAKKGISGIMVLFTRKIGEYNIDLSYEKVEKIANQVKLVPRSYINEKCNNVTNECMEYIAPLIQGEINTIFKNGLPVHFKIRG